MSNDQMRAKLDELEKLTRSCTEHTTLRGLLRAIPHLHCIVTLSFELTREVVSRVLPLESKS